MSRTRILQNIQRQKRDLARIKTKGRQTKQKTLPKLELPVFRKRRFNEGLY